MLSIPVVGVSRAEMVHAEIRPLSRVSIRMDVPQGPKRHESENQNINPNEVLRGRIIGRGASIRDREKYPSVLAITSTPNGSRKVCNSLFSHEVGNTRSISVPKHKRNFDF